MILPCHHVCIINHDSIKHNLIVEAVNTIQLKMIKVFKLNDDVAI